MAVTAHSVAPIHGCRTTKIYCLPSCPAGKRTKPENRLHFQSREEARSHGYRACKVCKPDMEPETFFRSSYQSPLGKYLLLSSQRGLVRVAPEGSKKATPGDWERAGHQVQEGGEHNEVLARELDAYFAGKVRQFSIPLDLRGTPFQRRVWQELCNISYGETRSYQEVASALGQPTATRAVGQAIGRNPVSIVVPCHRIIGANGSLTGYGGGLERKRALLGLEMYGSLGRVRVQ